MGHGLSVSVFAAAAGNEVEKEGGKTMMLEGKRAIITGAAGGQGEATAQLFIEHGARVMLTDLDGAACDTLAAELGESAMSAQHDITDTTGWDSVVSATVSAFGGVDILINNAGIFFTGEIGETTKADLERAFAINVTGAFLGISASLPHMPRGGSIVNVASGAGLSGMANMAAYSTSKWALRGMTRCAARDLAPKGIRVNALCPGVIDTPMIRNDDLPGFMEKIAAGIPLGRAGEPSEMAAASLYLASDASAFMTGQDLVVDGGRQA